MTETLSTAHRDDAPVTTSKTVSDPDQATASLIEPTGNQTAARSVTIAKPREELYRYWRDFTNLPHFMENIVSIEAKDDTRSHWVVKAPGDRTVEWDALVTDDVPGEAIGWKSAPDADVPNSGRIEFRDASGGRGTVVTAIISYDPPAGVIGKMVAKIFQREPAIQARRDLRRFKQLMETGEISTNARTRAEAAKGDQVTENRE